MTGLQRLAAGIVLIILLMIVLGFASHQLTSSVLVVAIPSLASLAGILAGLTDKKSKRGDDR